jgi:ankyrin repeat protein
MSSLNAPRKRLPVDPSVEHLRKQAKRRAKTNAISLSDAQHHLSREYGCRTWAELVHVVETMNRGGDQLVDVKRKVEPLPAAGRKRDLDEVRRILASGEYTVHDLDAGLAHAAWYGGDDPGVLKVRKAIFDLLLEHGADPDGQYGSSYGPLIFGCGECLDPHGLAWLLDAGANVSFEPVETKYGRQCALSSVLGTYARGLNQRKHRIIEMLLSAGAYVPPEVTPAILAIHQGDAAALGRLLDDDPELRSRSFAAMPYGNMSLAGATLLHCAVEFGEIECCDELIGRGADVNAKAQIIDGIGGQTPIFHAILTNQGRNFYTLEYLADRVGLRIDINVKATFRVYGQPHTNPVTPLEYAEEAAGESVPEWRRAGAEELELLRRLQQQSRPTADADDHLLKAIRARELAAAARALDAGADPNRRGQRGVTPLHLAAQHGPVEMVELLQSRGALAWMTDDQGWTAADHARNSQELRENHKARIVERLSGPRLDDPLFRRAVEAMDAGDLQTLQHLLRAHPHLVTMHAEEDAGSFAGPYFARPALLWFVANNPVRLQKMPENAVEIAEAIIDAGATRDDITYTLSLVSSGRIPHEQGLQMPLIELLVRRGGDPTKALDSAVQEREMDAAEALLRLRAKPSLFAAAALGDTARVRDLLQAGPAAEDRHRAAAMAAAYGQLECLDLLLDGGVDVNARVPQHPYSPTLLHQAAWFDQAATVERLLQLGADPTLRDTQYNSTPADWAEHAGHAELARRLREALPGCRINRP